MQVQIKKQLKIELDESDIVTAVRDYLSGNGYSISDTEAAKINFVKSPKDGLRAELNIVEETGVDAEVESPKQVTPILAIGNEPAESQDEEEGPGEVATSTPEDVMPGLNEIKAMVEPEAVVAEEAAAEAEVKEDSRKSLFL